MKTRQDKVLSDKSEFSNKNGPTQQVPQPFGQILSLTPYVGAAFVTRLESNEIQSGDTDFCSMRCTLHLTRFFCTLWENPFILASS